MGPRKFAGLLACVSLLLVSAEVSAQFNWECCDACIHSTEQVSLFSCPLGDGHRINRCMAFPGITNVDATITANLCDINGDPIYLYPASDIWLESAGESFTFCGGGTCADHDTDINGDTTFSNALYAGYHGSGAIVKVLGFVINAPLDLLFNSPDIDGDLAVTLTDVVLFTQDYFGGYEYRSDFYWDGVLNLSDIVILSQHHTHECP